MSMRPRKRAAACALAVTALATVLLAAPAVAFASGMDMYRLYNKWTGEHFYTASVSERDGLQDAGWRYEGVGWVAPSSGDPLYRLYNPYAPGGDHHYTLSAVERDVLVAQGWRYEGVAWSSGGTVEIYRQYNPYATTGTHNYTASAVENDVLVDAGWRGEGIAWRAMAEGRGVSEEEFVARARKKLGVPDLPSITYRISGPTY